MAGLPELRENIADFHQEVDDYPIRMYQVLVAPGSKPRLYNIMHAFENADIFCQALHGYRTPRKPV